MAYKEHAAADKYKHECQAKSADIPAASPKQNVASGEECQDPQNYLPWWYVLVAWPEGITVWAIIGTGFVVAWQSYETRKSAEAANKALELGKTKERAKLLLDLEPLNPTVGARTEASFSITNVGESYAVVIFALAGLYVLKSHKTLPVEFEDFPLKISNSALKAGGTSMEKAHWPGHPIGAFPPGITDDTYVAHFHCVIGFRDAFEDYWIMQFHYIWRQYDVEIWRPALDGETAKGEWEDQREDNKRHERRATNLETRRWRMLGSK